VRKNWRNRGHRRRRKKGRENEPISNRAADRGVVVFSHKVGVSARPDEGGGRHTGERGFS